MRCGSLSSFNARNLPVLEGDFEFGSSRLQSRDRHCALWGVGIQTLQARQTWGKPLIIRISKHTQSGGIRHGQRITHPVHRHAVCRPAWESSRPAGSARPKTNEIAIKLHVPFRVDRIDSANIQGHLVAMEAPGCGPLGLRREQRASFLTGVRGVSGSQIGQTPGGNFHVAWHPILNVSRSLVLPPHHTLCLVIHSAALSRLKRGLTTPCRVVECFAALPSPVGAFERCHGSTLDAILPLST